MSRPEHQAPPDIYYNAIEAEKYTNNSRIITVQRELAIRALELLALPIVEEISPNGFNFKFKKNGNTIHDFMKDNKENDDKDLTKEFTPSDHHHTEGSNNSSSISDDQDSSLDEDINSDNIEEEDDDGADDLLKVPMSETSYLLLDLGVGSGLCASVLEEAGHNWVGMDISASMLAVARQRQNANNLLGPGDLLEGDIGDGLSFRPGVFDGAVSISALQWLCNADKSSHSPRSRLTKLFTSLYACLRSGARAVFQFYPEDKFQIDMILQCAMKVGFNGGLVIDYPNSTKRKKYFLCLIAGWNGGALPRGRDDTDDAKLLPHPSRSLNTSIIVQNANRQSRKKSSALVSRFDRDWVLRKKELYRKRGYEDIPEDTKYTARKRRPRF